MDTVDAIVVGAGAVGLAIAAKLSERYAQVLIIDQHPEVGQETSSRNSEVIHAGIYYPQGSLKAQLCVRGKALLYDFCKRKDVPHKAVGKLIVAPIDESAQLESIKQKAINNGVNDLTFVDAKQLAKLEPQLQPEPSNQPQNALFSPSTGIIDSHAYMQALLHQAESNGAFFVGNSQFKQALKTQDGFEVEISNVTDNSTSKLRSSILINSAGLHAHNVASHIESLNPSTVPTMHYCRGHYFSYSGRSPFQHLIYPVPEKNTTGLGVHGTLDMDGQLRFGPDVQYINELDYRFSPHLKSKFCEAIKHYWPALDPERLQPAYTGIRPKLSGPNEAPKDFLILSQVEHSVEGLVNLFGIESPGLTASLAIAERVDNLLP
mgnify:CR=1 FL=1